MKPAPVNHGIKFRRIDLDDQPFIEAHVDNVQKVERATTLAKGSVKVHTVEHVISALTGMGVDNAIITEVGPNGDQRFKGVFIREAFQFAKAGNNIAKPMVLRQIQDGKYNVVAPSAFASHKINWPRK